MCTRGHNKSLFNNFAKNALNDWAQMIPKGGII